MTKADFIAGVAEVAGISKKDAGIALEAVLSQLTTAFSKGEDVSFVGFGTFNRHSARLFSFNSTP